MVCSIILLGPSVDLQGSVSMLLSSVWYSDLQTLAALFSLVSQLHIHNSRILLGSAWLSPPCTIARQWAITIIELILCYPLLWVHLFWLTTVTVKIALLHISHGRVNLVPITPLWLEAQYLFLTPVKCVTGINHLSLLWALLSYNSIVWSSSLWGG